MKETTTRLGCLLQRKILGFFGQDDEGQATTEYALILLAAAVIAVLVITWATAGGGAGRIGDRPHEHVLALAPHPGLPRRDSDHGRGGHGLSRGRRTVTR